jgi:hypothetical protein
MKYIYVILFLLFILLYTLLKVYSVNSIESYYNDNQIIVCLTTSPDRMLLMRKVIESILNQSYPPHFIRINIPFKKNNKQYTIPSFISNNPKIKIFRYSEDYGAIMKVLPSIIDYKNDENKIIIYTDDNSLLLPKTIETYLKFIYKNPKHIYCLSGLIYKNNNYEETVMKKIIEEVDIAESYMSVAFKSSIFKNVDYNYLKNNIKSDDIILSNFYKLNNIKILQISVPYVNHFRWWSSDCNLDYEVDI